LRAAKQPLFQLPALRSRLCLVLEQGKPLLLLALGRHGEGLKAFAVDHLLPVGSPDAGQKVGNSESALHHDLGDGEGVGDFRNCPAFLEKPVEGLELVHFVHGKAGNILDERRLHRVGIVALLHDGTGQGFNLKPLLFQRLGGKIASAAGDDAEALAVGTHEQGLENAALADAGEDVIERCFLGLVPDIGRRDMQFGQGDMTQFHDGGLAHAAASITGDANLRR
jgi:hypothetical protein